MKDLLILEKDNTIIKALKATISKKTHDLINVNYQIIYRPVIVDNLKENYDLIILNLNLLDVECIKFLQLIRLNYQSCPIIVYSDTQNVANTILRNNIYYVCKNEVRRGLNDLIEKLIDFEILDYYCFDSRLLLALKKIEYIKQVSNGVEIKTATDTYNLEASFEDLSKYVNNKRFYRIGDYYINIHFINEFGEDKVELSSISFPLCKNKIQDLKIAYLRYGI